MSSLLGIFLAFLHGIHWHRWLDIRLQSWLLLPLYALIPLALLRLIPGGLGTAGGVAGLILLVLLGQRWAQRRHYVHFQADPSLARPGAQPPLWPEDKLLLKATGRFGVEARTASLTQLLAYYRTFETREHAIMARQTPSRFCRVGDFPPEFLGMWYLFLQPQHLEAVEAGRLWFGPRPAPALRLRYTYLNAKGKRLPAAAYLSFASEPDRQRVWADLLLDLGGPARVPWRPSHP